MQLKNLLLPAFIFLSIHTATAQEGTKYGKNILGFSPLQISAPGVGFGISYERDLDKKGIATLYIPATFTIANTARGPYYYAGPSQKYSTFYFMPGIKFYPTGSKGVVKYAVGPNLALVAGERPYNGPNTPFTQPYPYSNNYIMKSRLSVGTMVFNYLNINPTEHLYIGLEMGMGVSYIDQDDGVNTNNMPFLFQFGAKLGYRF